MDLISSILPAADLKMRKRACFVGETYSMREQGIFTRIG
jgi:hypothetical protein